VQVNPQDLRKEAESGSPKDINEHHTVFVSEYVSRFGRMARPTRVTTIVGYMHTQLVNKQNYTEFI
jgi:hypothetical protein